MAYDLVIRGGTLVTHEGTGTGDVGVRDGRTVAVGDLSRTDGARSSDATASMFFQDHRHAVHFREPGNEHKEDLESGTAPRSWAGSRPSSRCPTPTRRPPRRRHWPTSWTGPTGGPGRTMRFMSAPRRKMRRPSVNSKISLDAAVSRSSWVLRTGSLLVPDDASLRRVLENSRRRVAIHAEDEERLKARASIASEAAHAPEPAAHPEWRDVETAFNATRRLISLAEELRRRVHVLHVTTREEATYLASHKDVASVEVTPQHLTLEAPHCYDRLGAFAQMNPPVREARHRSGLWQAVANGVVDVIGSDHAPHTREEKKPDLSEDTVGDAGRADSATRHVEPRPRGAFVVDALDRSPLPGTEPVVRDRRQRAAGGGLRCRLPRWSTSRHRARSRTTGLPPSAGGPPSPA